MNEAEYSSANILSRLFSSISADKLKESSDVQTAWMQTLLSIKSFQKDEVKPAEYGSQLLDHSKIIDLQNDVLIVETDHPGRIQMFQLYKRYILNGLKQKIPDIPVKNIVFKLKKPEKETVGLRMPTKEEFNKAAAEWDRKAGAVRAADAAGSAANAAPSLQKESSPSFVEAAYSNNAPKKPGAPLPPELQELFASMKENLNQ